MTNNLGTWRTIFEIGTDPTSPLSTCWLPPHLTPPSPPICLRPSFITRTLSLLEYEHLILADSYFVIHDLLVDETDPRIAARLEIELKDGRRVNENVFYRLMEGRIERVWSIVVCKGTSWDK